MTWGISSHPNEFEPNSLRTSDLSTTGNTGTSSAGVLCLDSLAVQDQLVWSKEGNDWDAYTMAGVRGRDGPLQN